MVGPLRLAAAQLREEGRYAEDSWILEAQGAGLRLVAPKRWAATAGGALGGLLAGLLFAGLPLLLIVVLELRSLAHWIWLSAASLALALLLALVVRPWILGFMAAHARRETSATVQEAQLHRLFHELLVDAQGERMVLQVRGRRGSVRRLLEGVGFPPPPAP